MDTQHRTPEEARTPGTVSERSLSQLRADGSATAAIGGLTAAVRTQRADSSRTEPVDDAAQSLRTVPSVGALVLLRGITYAIANIDHRQQLLDEACRIAVLDGALRIAWIASLRADSPDADIVASYGAPPGILDDESVTARDGLAMSRLPGSCALRLGQPVICNDIAAEQVMHPRQRVLLEQGIRSIAAFPLRVNGHISAVLEVLASSPEMFNTQTQQAFVDFAAMLSLGIQHVDAQERLRFLTRCDVQTGLFNAAYFKRTVDDMLRTASERGSSCCVLLLEVSSLSATDAIDHQRDAVLAAMVKRVRDAFPDAPIGRMAANSMATVLCESTESLTIRLEQLLPQLQLPVSMGGASFDPGLAAGLASFPVDGHDAETLLLLARKAAARAVLEGKPLALFSAKPGSDAAALLNVRLQEAFSRQQFVLHYQPKMAFRDGRIVGFEALLRWNDPKAGIVAPVSFIGAMETSGLIGVVGEWALCQALGDYARWQHAGLHPPRVTVKVSPVQLRADNFVTRISAALQAAQVLPGALEIAVAESVVTQAAQTHAHVLHRIRALGVSIAVENFGSGCWSLRDLTQFPVDSVKIDRSLVATMMHDEQSLRMVATNLALAHALDFTVVAEGVETQEQSRLLKLLHCDEQRGFLLSRPLPAAACAGLLCQHNDARAIKGRNRASGP